MVLYDATVYDAWCNFMVAADFGPSRESRETGPGWAAAGRQAGSRSMAVQQAR